jgi:hypothetical protein
VITIETTEVFGKGLKVYLTVNSDLSSQSANIVTWQGASEKYSHNDFINTGSTQLTLEYPDGLINTGEFRLCVTAGSYSNCSLGYNSEEKKPEYITVDLYAPRSIVPQTHEQQGQSQSQSQSSDNTIIICNREQCDVRQ